MTTPVCVQQRIRQLDRQGLSHREISRKLGVSRTTVVKYANHGDYSPKPLGSGHAGRSLVDAGYSAVVDGWPAADLRMPVKQRHTATRVCVCSIESGPCERVDVFHVSGRFWSTSACGEKRTPARPAWTSFPS